MRAGVDYIVVGRPIIEAKDPVAAARAIVAEMDSSASNRAVGGSSNSRIRILKVRVGRIESLFHAIYPRYRKK